MWVQISFEIYLIFLITLVIVLGKNVKVSTFLHRHKLNPVNTLATLLMLSYEKLSRRIFSLLSYTKLTYPNETVTVWLFDPSLDYMEGKHISLAVVAVVILATGIFFNIVLLFSKFIISHATSVYINTFLEAFHAPFKPNHKYWAGLLLLIRNVSYFVSEFLNAGGNPRYNLSFIFALVMGLLMIKFVYVCMANFSDISVRNLKRVFQEYAYGTLRDQSNSECVHKCSGIVYNNPLLDLLETSFLVNLSVLTYFTLYISVDGGKQSALFYVSSSIVFATFLGILAYHICSYTFISNHLKKCGKKLIKESKVLDTGRDNNYGSTSTTDTYTLV